MRKTLLALVALIAVTLVGPAGSANAGRSVSINIYHARLSSDQEVPPVAVPSAARGNMHLLLSRDGQTLYYRLTVHRIENVTMAHIHIAPQGAAGPIVVWLRPSGPPAQLIPGPFNGVLAQGTITAANLVGPLAGMPLSALVAKLDSGEAYVNVHTQRNPPGEIRGQLFCVLH